MTCVGSQPGEGVRAVIAHIRDCYGVEPDYLWHDDCAAFRHPEDKRWFAVLMPGIARERLSLPGEGRVDILDVKCDPALIPSLIDGCGVLPGYHMNKEHWITLTLDGAVPQETLASLIGMSFDCTLKKRRKLRQGGTHGNI